MKLKRERLVSDGAFARMMQNAAELWNNCDFQACAEVMERASRLDPANHSVLLDLGAVYGKTHDYAAAEHLVKNRLMLPADTALMKMLNPLGKIVQNSVESTDPKINDGSFYAAWRTLALGLLEYRRGNFTAAAAWLDKCSQYPGQVSSCIALRHALASSVLFHLGKVQEGKVELTLADEMIGEYLNHGKLGGGDNTSGHVQGWLQARVLLREAETTEPKFENANAFTSNR